MEWSKEAGGGGGREGGNAARNSVGSFWTVLARRFLNIFDGFSWFWNKNFVENVVNELGGNLEAIRIWIGWDLGHLIGSISEKSTHPLAIAAGASVGFRLISLFW